VKRVGSRRYLHRSSIDQLTARDRRRVEAVSARAPELDWSVVRLSPGEVMLGRTTSFDRCDHPALEESVRWDGRRLTNRTYRGDASPVYHRCEQLLDVEHPRHAYFTRLTAREEAAGLLGRRDIGTVGAWKRAKNARRHS
jgi:hypothetical protein